VGKLNVARWEVLFSINICNSLNRARDIVALSVLVDYVAAEMLFHPWFSFGIRQICDHAVEMVMVAM
jgi:hypothetical protein